MKSQLIECVPNFSEGRDAVVIQQIADAIASVEGVKLLDVDPGKATNRTVMTFVGSPDAVIEGAFQGIKKASELIDMRYHTGEHPRMGATDVCPLIPIANISMEETVEYARRLGERVAKALNIPIYLYEAAATKSDRKNLATIRAGEYEGFSEKIKNPNWQPDFGEPIFNEQAGATVIGARDFLIAYNINLNTTSVRRANAIAFDVREKGRAKKKRGEVVRDKAGDAVRIPGTCKGVKAIGWFIEEYGIAQISMNITNIQQTPVHIAFEACRESANRRGLRVSGSELIGMAPLSVFLDAGRYFLKQQKRSVGVSEAELIKIAVKSMGLDDLQPFDPNQKIIEYQLRNIEDQPLIHQTLTAFADETASESPAPGGGSISAYVGALGVSLATMVANLSSHKRGWDKRWATFSEWADKGQQLKNELLRLVDEDTHSFNQIIAAFRLPKNTEAAKQQRNDAIQAATKYAIEVPFKVMQVSLSSFEMIRAMAKTGNPNSVTDAGVGALCARVAVHGAFLNVKINTADLKDKAFVEKVLAEGEAMIAKADELEKEILAIVNQKI